MIEVIQAKVNLNKTFLKMELSLENIKKNNPHRKDLIESMDESLNDIAEAQLLLHRLDLKCMSLSGDLYRKNHLLLKLQTEINDLKKKNNLLNNNF